MVPRDRRVRKSLFCLRVAQQNAPNKLPIDCRTRHGFLYSRHHTVKPSSPPLYPKFGVFVGKGTAQQQCCSDEEANPRAAGIGCEKTSTLTSSRNFPLCSVTANSASLAGFRQAGRQTGG